MAITTSARGTQAGKRPGRKNRWIFSKCLLLTSLTFGSHSAIAQNWEIEPFVQLIATYTDNLFLAEEGLEESDYVGQINPGITIVKNDGRFTTDTYYRLQSIYFAGDSDRNTIFQQLDATATLEVAADTFFVDANAAIGQSVLDPTQPISTSNVITTSNYGDVSYIDVNPYLVQQFGGSNTYARVDYTLGKGRYDDFETGEFSRVDDFVQQLWSGYLGTVRQDAGFDWAFTYDNQYVDYETITDFRYERAGGMAGLRLGRNFRLIAMGGFESDLLLGRDYGGLDSDYWEVGFSIDSGSRNSFEFRFGERFFGDTYFADLEYEGRVVSASITYSETPTTSALDGPESVGSGFSVSEQDAVFEDDLGTDELVIVPIRAEAYISRMLTSRVEFSGNRSLLFLAYIDEDREFIDFVEGLDGEEDRQNSFTIGFRYDIGPRTEFDLSAALAGYEYDSTEVTSEVVSIVAGISRRLGRETDIRVSIRRAEQEVEDASGIGNYVENAVDIGLVKRF